MFIYLLIYGHATRLVGGLSSRTSDQTHAPLQWKCRVLTTGLPGNSLIAVLISIPLFTNKVEHLFMIHWPFGFPLL